MKTWIILLLVSNNLMTIYFKRGYNSMMPGFHMDFLPLNSVSDVEIIGIS